MAPYLGEAGQVPQWELTDAIDAGDVPKAIDRLHRMLEAGDRHPLGVLAALHGHYAGRAVGLLADADLDMRGRTAWPPELVAEVLVARLASMNRR